MLGSEPSPNHAKEGGSEAVELVLGHQRLVDPGGSETYLLTLAEHLQRLGHEVTIFAIEAGEMAQAASSRGLRVTTVEHELPRECDGVVAQDGVVSLILAERYPATSQLFVAHAPGIDLQRPPQLEGVVSAVIALNDRVAKRLGGLAQQHEIVRLRQPIDVHRFVPRGNPRSVPEQVLVLSNRLRESERERLANVCNATGIRLDRVGSPGRSSTTPELDIAASDITIAHGRGALEGMASGRAVYVLDHWGGDGWVTPASYPMLEANGFAGGATREPIDGERLSRDLAAYRREMGTVNRQLACVNHHAMDHACELVSLFRRTSRRRPPPNAPLREMARLVRVQWQTEGRCAAFAAESEALREQLDQERKQMAAFQRTRRYRLAQLLARPLDALRRRR
jgi:hypothetical protein